jgi:hypothetical protein
MFKVPEAGRDTTHPSMHTTIADGNNGAFYVQSPEPGWMLALVCSDCLHPDMSEEELALPKWEHVSVHAYKDHGRRFQERTPTWKEMHYVKTLCWDDDDVVMQLHPMKREYVNCHPHVLHLWRPVDVTIPTPPKMFV